MSVTAILHIATQLMLPVGLALGQLMVVTQLNLINNLEADICITTAVPTIVVS